MVLEFIFQLPPLVTIAIISLVISLIIVLVYKFLTNQREMKDMKDKLKDYQKQMKELRNDPKRLMEVQKEAMQLNMKYMKHSLKPTLITFLPIILIFGWLSAHLAYLPIESGQEFTTTIAFDKGTTGVIEMLESECNVVFEERYPVCFKRGSISYKVPRILRSDDGDITRKKWILDKNTPDFLDEDGRDFVMNIIHSGSDILNPERDIIER